MNWKRIEMAKQALILFLKSLPFDSYFNIYSFGDKFIKMFETSQKYDETTVQIALD